MWKTKLATVVIAGAWAAACSKAGTKAGEPPDPSTAHEPLRPTKRAPERAGAQSTRSLPWLEQGWSDETRQRFYFESQGSATFPIAYEWFVALEQASEAPEQESKLLRDASYLQRFRLHRCRKRGRSRARRVADRL
jgi:hypothetical protein